MSRTTRLIKFILTISYVLSACSGLDLVYGCYKGTISPNQLPLFESLQLINTGFFLKILGFYIIIKLICFSFDIWYGKYDEWMIENTDPYLKKICDFINRRNGGCDE